MVVDISYMLQEFVDFLVESGRFPSPSAVVEAALTALNEKELTREIPEDQLEAMYPGIAEMAAEGWAAAEAGEVSDGEEFFEELDRKLSQDISPDRKTA